VFRSSGVLYGVKFSHGGLSAVMKLVKLFAESVCEIQLVRLFAI
jgi:hypothetical protein